jgi:hypothetical protein
MEGKEIGFSKERIQDEVGGGVLGGASAMAIFRLALQNATRYG